MQVYKYKSIPDPEKIGNHLYRVQIPQPFYADNNIYIIDSDEPAMIDSGYIQNLGILQRSLRKIGLSLSKIKHIFYTHNHIDHISAAITMRSYSDAKLYGMVNMSSATGNFLEYMSFFQRGENRIIYKAISSPELRKNYIQKMEKIRKDLSEAYIHSNKVDLNLKMDVELVEGDVIDIGDRLIGFLHTPGHNLWHLTPYILGEGTYFTGDLVLGNISSIYAEIDGNLAHYLKSLERLMNIPIKRLLPAHGEEPSDPGKAIKTLHKTLSILERGVIRRLKQKEYDLHDLASEAMGDKVKENPYYIVALAIIHAILLKWIESGDVRVIEVDPPYERYRWIDDKL
ncbi:MAG: MBL fold metallo-hydrolase [Leptospiraceae bacterium]|nr:MBL fold metallo-hydrolase [Leptospiraceae bacterium]MCP5510297.1 MBL fold metallo-hydrolase [Leptospiraceae bacterium]